MARCRAAAAAAPAAAARGLGFLLGIWYAFTHVDFAYGVPGWVVALLVVPNVLVGLTPALVVLAVLAWRRRWWSVAGRLQYSLTAAAALGFVWFCALWNLLGMRV